MKTVGLMIGYLYFAGAEQQVTFLAKELRARGTAVSVLVMFTEGGPVEAELRDAGVPVINLGFRTFAETGWRFPFVNARACLRTVRVLRRLDFDVLQAYLFEVYVAAAVLARLAGVRVLVASQHCSPTIYGSGRVRRLIDSWATGVSDAVTTVSEDLARQTRDFTKAPAEKVKVIYNGLPESAFTPVAPAPLDTPHPVIVYVARMCPYKGHRYLVDAVALLRGRGLDCTVVLLGEGAEQAAIAARSERLGVDVRTLGLRSDVGAWLARADVMAHPSLTEGFSVAVMEGMAAGLPVVSTSVGGQPELVGDRGLLVPPADAVALADALERLLRDGDLAKDLSVRARAWSRENLTVERMADQYMAVFRSVAHRRTMGGR